MPQMMPLNWIYMFIQLTMIISILMILLFFMLPSTPPTNKSSVTPPTLSWKW